MVFSGLSRKRVLASRCLAMDYSGFQASCHNTCVFLFAITFQHTKLFADVLPQQKNRPQIGSQIRRSAFILRNVGEGKWQYHVFARPSF
jgi:hypothetical protein